MRKNLTIKITLLALVLALGVSPLLLWSPSGEQPPVEPRAEAHFGSLSNVEMAYQNWYDRYVENGGDHSYTIPVGRFDGVSAEPTRAAGTVSLDLFDGRAVVEIRNLTDVTDSDVWLIDKQPDNGLLPNDADRIVRLGSLEPRDGEGRLATELGSGFFSRFEPDMAVVTRRGVSPTEAGILYGKPTAFQTHYFRTRQTALAAPRTPGAERGSLASLLSPRAAFAQLTTTADAGNPFTPEPLDSQITRGANLFFNGTFKGNGRTCGTCHPADNNFTIDPRFISTLPDTDPLFVAEIGHPNHVPNLERPELMRALGVILENVDGLEDPNNKFVLRGVPHTLALPTSITKGNDCPDFADATGWSCDGAPFGGSLNQFAAGAVRQHFTTDIARDPGTHFVFPTQSELDAMEVFQLALGRQSDPDLADLTFSNPLADAGEEIFVNSICNGCHNNATANVSGGINLNFDTGVERLEANPMDIIDPANAKDDGGFGANTLCLFDPNDPTNSNGFGNCEFNTPPLVEAADTAPFFHNNAVATLEGAIAFYNSDAFQAAAGTTAGFDSSEVDAVSAFLRALNALENIRNAVELANNAQTTSSLTVSDAIIAVCIADVQDGIEVLEERTINLDAIGYLRQAEEAYEKAAAQTTVAERDALLQEGNQAALAARDAIASGPLPPFF